MTVNDQIKAMEKVLADTYALYLKTQNYHWNIIGIDFHQFHFVLESQYRELLEPIDTIAERIRSIGAHVTGSFVAFIELKTIDEAIPVATAEEMVHDLYYDQEKIIKTLKYGLSESDKVGDLVTIDMLIQRIAVHEKNHWMLGATLNKPHSRISNIA